MEIEVSKENANVFAIESFGSNKKILISEVNANNVTDYLYRLDCWEISLTKLGAKYLIENIGMKFMVENILAEINNGADYKNRNKEAIENWLKQEISKAI